MGKGVTLPPLFQGSCARGHETLHLLLRKKVLMYIFHVTGCFYTHETLHLLLRKKVLMYIFPVTGCLHAQSRPITFRDEAFHSVVHAIGVADVVIIQLSPLDP